MEFPFRREVLIEARLRAGLSIVELATLAGVSEGALRNLESETTARPQPRTVKAVADALDVDIDDVYDFTAGVA